MKQKILQIIKKIAALHPYKKLGDPNSYNDYNQGWEDACGVIEDEVNNFKMKSLDEIILEIIKDLEAGVYNNGQKLSKVKKNLIWGQLFKKMNQSIDNLLNQSRIEKVDCCSNVSYKIKG